MSLNWELKNKETVEELTNDENWGMTQNMIFGTMSIGLRSITQENWKDFYARMVVTFPKVGITPEDVYKRIGLQTNAETLTQLQWMKRMTLNNVGDALYIATRWNQKRLEDEKLDAAGKAPEPLAPWEIELMTAGEEN